jgi:putative glutamine amidotransferase
MCALLAPDPALVGDPDEALDLLDGLLLAGGADIDPHAYGCARHSETVDTYPERDDFEIAMVRRALERDIPVLAICRGVQLLNVALGGTLHQHLPDSHGHHEHRRVRGTFDGADHDVRVIDGTLASGAIGEQVHGTKSHHHQGLDQIGEGLLVSAYAVLDDLPEALELPGNRFALGVQWHPEADAESPVIPALIAAAREHAAQRAGAGSAAARL